MLYYEVGRISSRIMNSSLSYWRFRLKLSHYCITPVQGQGLMKNVLLAGQANMLKWAMLTQLNDRLYSHQT